MNGLSVKVLRSLRTLIQDKRERQVYIATAWDGERIRLSLLLQNSSGHGLAEACSEQLLLVNLPG